MSLDNLQQVIDTSFDKILRCHLSGQEHVDPNTRDQLWVVSDDEGL